MCHFVSYSDSIIISIRVDFICMYLYKAYFIYYQSKSITKNLFVSKMWRSSNKNMLDQCQKYFCGSYIDCHTSRLSHYTALNQSYSNGFDIGFVYQSKNRSQVTPELLNFYLFFIGLRFGFNVMKPTVQQDII